jgi:hypothetical protein
MATDLTILRYLRQAAHEPDLDDRVRLCVGRRRVVLHAALLPGRVGNPPPGLPCAGDQLRRLYAVGWVLASRTHARLTPLGEHALAQGLAR